MFQTRGGLGQKIQPWHCSHTGPHCPTHGNTHSLLTFVYRWWNNISSTVTDISTFNVSGKQCWASYSIGVLRLIGYRSLLADNRLGVFDRRSLKRPFSKKTISSWWRACCERFGTTCSAPSQSLSGAGEIIIMLKVRYNSYIFINNL